MPSFTSQIPNLQTAGPIVEVRLAVGAMAEAALKAAKAPVPAPVPVLAMVDTGASATVIRQGMALQLGLKPVGATLVNTPSSENVRCLKYLLRLLLPNNVVVETTSIEAPLQGQPIQCLIGRDVLANAVLVYVGYANQFTLSF